MPIQTIELNPIEDKILAILKENIAMAFSSKEIAEILDIAHSTARKHLLTLFNNKREVKRGKQKDFNKTFFYYVEN